MDGVILVNKPKGCTSHDIVYKVKKIFNTKVGHTGTLDPNATGVLPLLVGKGTLLSKYLINHDKKYEVILKLGKKTDTADSEGIIIETQEVNENLIKPDNVKLVLKSFLGKQEQIPPMYSAIKVNGRKLYEYARKGENVNLKPRQIEIYNINLIEIHKDEICFEVHCSKGTYIRSLCEDIATKLFTVGYMKELKRLQVGEFKIQDAITVEELERSYNESSIGKKIVSIEKILKNNPSINLQEKQLRLFLNGVKLNYPLENGVYKIYNNKGDFIGTGVINNSELKRDIIINS